MIKKPFYCAKHLLPKVEHTFNGPLAEALDELNDNYTIVKNGSKKFAFDHRHQKFLPATSVQFHHSTNHQWMGKNYNSSQLWYKEYHRSYEKMVFLPGEAPVVDNAFNEWQGWDCPLLEKEHVDWSVVHTIIAFLESWVCQYNQKTCTELIQFMARLIQTPDEHEQQFILIEQDKSGLRAIIMELMECLMPWHYSIRLHETNNLGTKFVQFTEKRLLTYFYEIPWEDKSKLTAKVESMMSSPFFEDRRHYNRFVISGYDNVQISKTMRKNAIAILCNKKQDPYYAMEYIKDLLRQPNAIASWAYFLYHFD